MAQVVLIQPLCKYLGITNKVMERQWHALNLYSSTAFNSWLWHHLMHLVLLVLKYNKLCVESYAGHYSTVKELPIDSALGVLATINIARTHSVSTGDNSDFEITLQIFHFSHDRLEILHTGREWQYAKSCRTEFWISSPKKIGAPLNFAFALRPMGREISNRLYSSFRNCFGPFFLDILGRMCKSLLWDFALWEVFLTRFFSIFVSFTAPLIFMQPSKLACWNFYTPCHSCMAPIGATRGGAKMVLG